MKVCKECGEEKPIKSFASYKNYPTRLRTSCKECEKEKARRRGEKIREELERLNKEEEEIINEFNKLMVADKILKLFQEGYDISWSGKDTIIFNKGKKTVHAKNANKQIYDLVFARYCIEIKKYINKNK